MALLILVAGASPSGSQTGPTSGTAAATLDDTSLVPGQVVGIRGSGWKPNRPVKIQLHPGRQETTVTAGADGTFSTGFPIPGDARTLPYGITVAGLGADGLVAYLQNNVTITAPRPVASLDDTNLAPGQVVGISGERWKPGGVVKVTLHPGKQQTSITAGGDGRLSGTFAIPDDAVTSRYGITIGGVGADGLYAYLENDVTITATPASATLADTALVPGQKVDVDGQHWKPGKVVKITLHPGKHELQVTVPASRSFSAKFEVPRSAATGRYGITVAGTGSDGRFHYLQNDVTIRRGGEPNVLTAATLTPGSSTTVSRGADLPTTTLPRPSAEGRGTSDMSWLLVVLVVVMLLALLLLVLSSRPETKRAWRRFRHRISRPAH